MTISRVKFPWPPFFRIFIFFDEVFNLARGTTYLMRDDGATVVNLRHSRVTVAGHLLKKSGFVAARLSGPSAPAAQL